jgi:hypothetical protein
MNLKLTKSLRRSELYFRFLQLSETLRGQPALPALVPLECCILELIIYARQKKEGVSVKDLIGKRELGSPAILHSCLASMLEKGWILLEDTEGDQLKQLDLTTAALTHFAKLSRLMMQAIKRTGLV